MKIFSILSLLTFIVSGTVHALSYFPSMELKNDYFLWLHILTLMCFTSAGYYSWRYSQGENTILEGIKIPYWVILLFTMSIAYAISFMYVSEKPSATLYKIVDGDIKITRIGKLVNEVVNKTNKTPTLETSINRVLSSLSTLSSHTHVNQQGISTLF